MIDAYFYMTDAELKAELSKMTKAQLIEKALGLAKDKKSLIKKYEWIEGKYFDFVDHIQPEYQARCRQIDGRRKATRHKLDGKEEKLATIKSALATMETGKLTERNRAKKVSDKTGLPFGTVRRLLERI